MAPIRSPCLYSSTFSPLNRALAPKSRNSHSLDEYPNDLPGAPSQSDGKRGLFGSGTRVLLNGGFFHHHTHIHRGQGIEVFVEQNLDDQGRYAICAGRLVQKNPSKRLQDWPNYGLRALVNKGKDACNYI
ncbi:hypothetical protein BJ165DRAFT_1405618 [Panaeolus papilionaceus]|nr:hypothetical protein BJ165DRAFT_1405618 [Panaeolus papilionaceus]